MTKLDIFHNSMHASLVNLLNSYSCSSAQIPFKYLNIIDLIINLMSFRHYDPYPFYYILIIL